jgi:hypothetical protein
LLLFFSVWSWLAGTNRTVGREPFPVPEDALEQAPPALPARQGNQGCQMVYFHTKKSHLGSLESLGMENIGIFYGHLVYFKAIWYIL